MSRSGKNIVADKLEARIARAEEVRDGLLDRQLMVELEIGENYYNLYRKVEGNENTKQIIRSEFENKLPSNLKKELNDQRILEENQKAISTQPEKDKIRYELDKALVEIGKKVVEVDFIMPYPVYRLNAIKEKQMTNQQVRKELEDEGRRNVFTEIYKMIDKVANDRDTPADLRVSFNQEKIKLSNNLANIRRAITALNNEINGLKLERNSIQADKSKEIELTVVPEKGKQSKGVGISSTFFGARTQSLARSMPERAGVGEAEKKKTVPTINLKEDGMNSAHYDEEQLASSKGKQRSRK